MYINFERMVPKAPPIRRPIVNRYGVQLLMPCPIPILKPRKTVIVSDVIPQEILEGIFWIVGIGYW